MHKSDCPAHQTPTGITLLQKEVSERGREKGGERGEGVWAGGGQNAARTQGNVHAQDFARALCRDEEEP
jgi:hypothetical protein